MILSGCGAREEKIPAAPVAGPGRVPVGSGKPLPAFSLKSPDGGPVAFGPGAESPLVLLEVWSPTWFPGAKVQRDRLIELHERWGNRGVRVLALAYDETPKAVKAALSDKGDALFEVAMGTDSLFESLGLEAIPTTWLVDREGRVIERLEGYQPLEVLEAKLHELLGPKAPK